VAGRCFSGRFAAETIVLVAAPRRVVTHCCCGGRSRCRLRDTFHPWWFGLGQLSQEATNSCSKCHFSAAHINAEPMSVKWSGSALAWSSTGIGVSITSNTSQCTASALDGSVDGEIGTKRELHHINMVISSTVWFILVSITCVLHPLNNIDQRPSQHHPRSPRLVTRCPTVGELCEETFHCQALKTQAQWTPPLDSKTLTTQASLTLTVSRTNELLHDDSSSRHQRKTPERQQRTTRCPKATVSSTKCVRRQLWCSPVQSCCSWKSKLSSRNSRVTLQSSVPSFPKLV